MRAYLRQIKDGIEIDFEFKMSQQMMMTYELLKDSVIKPETIINNLVDGFKKTIDNDIKTFLHGVFIEAEDGGVKEIVGTLRNDEQNKKFRVPINERL